MHGLSVCTTDAMEVRGMVTLWASRSDFSPEPSVLPAPVGLEWDPTIRF